MRSAGSVSDYDTDDLREVCANLKQFRSAYIQYYAAIWTILRDQYQGTKRSKRQAAKAEASARKTAHTVEWEMERLHVLDYLQWARNRVLESRCIYDGVLLDGFVAYYLDLYAENDYHWNTVLGLLEAGAKIVEQRYDFWFSRICAYQDRAPNADDFHAYVWSTGVVWTRRKSRFGMTNIRRLGRKLVASILF